MGSVGGSWSGGLLDQNLTSWSSSRRESETPGAEKRLICWCSFYGANRDRTGDLLLAKQALSQLSYGPRNPSIYAVQSRFRDIIALAARGEIETCPAAAAARCCPIASRSAAPIGGVCRIAASC